jgi:hypothetical protein
MTGVMLPDVAFVGRAGAGKTTAAELLVKRFGYERLSFAAPLKTGVGSTTDRGLLQDVGVGVRALCPDFWVNLLVAEHSRSVRESECNAPNFTVDDCRFPNEAQRLKIEGFLIVRVEARRSERLLRLKANGKLQDESQLEHESETALDDFVADQTIYNSGGPDWLLEQLTEVLNWSRS